MGVIDAVISAPSALHYPRLLNAVRLLARLLPIVFEESGEEAQAATARGAAAVPGDQFVRRLFWENELPRVVPASSLAGAGGAAAAAAAAAAAVEEEEEYVLVWEPRLDAEAAYPLGAQLCHCAMAALYLPDLTVERGQYDLFVTKLTATREAAAARGGGGGGGGGGDAGGAASGSAAGAQAAAAGEAGEQDSFEDGDGDGAAVVPDEANAVWPMLLYSGGVGFPKLAPPTSTAWTGPRLDVLRLLTALCCAPLYEPPVAGARSRSPFLAELTSTGCPFAPTTFYSLLNTILSYDPIGACARATAHAATLVRASDLQQPLPRATTAPFTPPAPPPSPT